jgi:hypothetical protein
MNRPYQWFVITNVFWDVALYSLVESHRRFRGAYCPSHQGYVTRRNIPKLSSYIALLSCYSCEAILFAVSLLGKHSNGLSLMLNATELQALRPNLNYVSGHGPWDSSVSSKRQLLHRGKTCEWYGFELTQAWHGFERVVCGSAVNYLREVVRVPLVGVFRNFLQMFCRLIK